MTMLAVDDAIAGDVQQWPLCQRITFRFAAAYWVAYLLTYMPGFFDDIPATRWMAIAARWPMERLVVWTGRHVFGVVVPLTQSGSGDKLFDWVQGLCIAVAAISGGAAWWVIDRKRREYSLVDTWLRVVLRYSLAVPMISYGMFKVIKLQFGSASIDRLLEPYGKSSPMGLLWTFMGYSTGYNLFTGLVETLAGLFLLTQKTTPMGAFLVIIGMTNVVILNFTYDVPVKLYSSNLLLMGIFLLLPYAGRVLSVLVLNRPTNAAPVRPRPSTPGRRRLQLWLKLGATAFVLYLGAWGPISFRLSNPGDFSPPPALFGVYDVVEHTRAGVVVPPLFTDATRWRRVAYNRTGVVSVYFADDTSRRFRANDDPAAHTLELANLVKPDGKETLRYEREADGTLKIRGTFAFTPIEATLRPVPLDSYLLVGRGFNWIQEMPFNR